MPKKEDEPHQHDIFSLLPGSKGGRALRDQKGSEHFAQIAKEAAARRTREERRKIALKAAKERRRRYLYEPRTEVIETSFMRIVERIIPFWRPSKTKRPRKLPEFVRVELEVIEKQDKEPPRYFILEEANRYR